MINRLQPGTLNRKNAFTEPGGPLIVDATNLLLSAFPWIVGNLNDPLDVAYFDDTQYPRPNKGIRQERFVIQPFGYTPENVKIVVQRNPNRPNQEGWFTILKGITSHRETFSLKPWGKYSNIPTDVLEAASAILQYIRTNSTYATYPLFRTVRTCRKISNSNVFEGVIDLTPNTIVTISPSSRAWARTPQLEERTLRPWAWNVSPGGQGCGLILANSQPACNPDWPDFSANEIIGWTYNTP